MSSAPPTGTGVIALCGELRDLLALEVRLHARVRAELSAQLEHESTRLLLQRLEPRAYAHQAALEGALERLHAGIPVLRRTFAALLGRLARWLVPVRPRPEGTGEVYDLYALLSTLAAAYLVLATSASALGDEQTTTLAEGGADDANEFLDEIALLLPDLARAALEGDAEKSFTPGETKTPERD